MTIQEVISQFNTTPFIFAGSGITRRYYGLPDWSGLLTVFAEKISDDAFAYRSYENQAQYSVSAVDKMPMIATLIEKDFNEAWFTIHLSKQEKIKGFPAFPKFLPLFPGQ